MKTKINDRLQKFSQALAAGRRTKDVEVFGMHFKLRTITQAEEDLANSMIGATNSAVEASEKRARAMLAVSISEIDHKVIEDVFEVSDLEPHEAAALLDKNTKREWAQRELYDWLAQQEPEVSGELYSEFRTLIAEKRLALRDIKPFS